MVDAMDMKTLQDELEKRGYFADDSLVTALFLAEKLKRPLFLEGEPGVGKTEIAKVWADLTGGRLIRIQCYPGLESNEVLYEWNYLKQILSIRVKESRLKENTEDVLEENELFTSEFLLARPLLDAVKSKEPVVLLIDEIDRADERFEAFLLEFLSDFQISIPELGTITAEHRPRVILTSNRTREVHDALRRRCLYQWIDYPTIEKEMAIVKAKAPDLSDRLIKQICSFVATLRTKPLDKKPGMAETLDWVETLIHTKNDNIFDVKASGTFSSLLKTKEDREWVQTSLQDIYREGRVLLSRLGS